MNPEKTWKIVELVLTVLTTVVAIIKRSFPEVDANDEK